MPEQPHVYDRLRAQILDLERVPGSRVTERGLESELGASRTPLRAALMRLETEGLVARDGRAWQVSPIDLGEISRLSELREANETAAARLTCARGDADGIAALSERVMAPEPRMIIGRLASLRTLAKAWVPLAMAARTPSSAPSCSTL